MFGQLAYKFRIAGKAMKSILDQLSHFLYPLEHLSADRLLRVILYKKVSEIYYGLCMIYRTIRKFLFCYLE